MLGSLAAGATFLQDIKRYRFLSSVYQCVAPGWEVRPRAEVTSAHRAASALRFLADCGAESVLLARAQEAASAYRLNEHPTVVAFVPAELAPARRVLLQRMVFCANLVVLEAAAALALAVMLILHAPALTGIVAVTVEDDHACALHRDGNVLCWGANEAGQLGDGTYDHRFHPVAVKGLTEAAQIVSTGISTCARRRDGTVMCWGNIDQAPTEGKAACPFKSCPEPTRIEGLPPARWIAGGGGRACAITEDDHILCWRSSTDRAAHGRGVQVQMPSGTPDLLIAYWGGCVREVDGVQCWGPGEDDPTAQGKVLPCFPATTLPPGAPAGVPGTLAWGRGICESTETGKLRCWGLLNPKTHQCPEVVELDDWTGGQRSVLGPDGGCVLDRQGRVRCQVRGPWRDDLPLEWTGPMLTNVTDIASTMFPRNDSREVCAVRSDGTVWCWGAENLRGAARRRDASGELLARGGPALAPGRHTKRSGRPRRGRAGVKILVLAAFSSDVRKRPQCRRGCLPPLPPLGRGSCDVGPVPAAYFKTWPTTPSLVPDHSRSRRQARGSRRRSGTHDPHGGLSVRRLPPSTAVRY